MDHWTENYCEEENNLFFFSKIMLLPYLYFFENVFAICEFSF